METHCEGLIVGRACGPPFGTAATRQQSEVGRFGRVPRKPASADVKHFGEDNSAHFDTVAGLAIKLAGLERVAHRSWRSDQRTPGGLDAAIRSSSRWRPGL